MNFVHGKSGECVKTELDLFSVPPTQVSLEKGLWIDHQPVSSVADGGPITFLCPGTEDYVDLSKTILVVRAKVTKANGDDLDADDHVGIINNFLHSLFKQVDVFLKEKQVTQATGTYAYRAYLETLLNYGPAAKESQLTAAMFYKDTAGKMDAADPTLAANNANANLGLKNRYEFNKESGVIEMAGPLFCDVFKSERLLLSFVDLKVILNRNIDAFCIMSDIDGATHKVKLTEAYLKVRKVKVSPSVSIAHELALKKGPAIYPVRRVECKTFIIPTGNPSLRKDNLYNGTVQHSMVTTRKILSILKPLPLRSLESPSTGKKYLLNPYSFPIQQQPFDIWRPTSPCSLAPESYFTIQEMAFRAMILRAVMLCMLLT